MDIDKYNLISKESSTSTNYVTNNRKYLFVLLFNLLYSVYATIQWDLPLKKYALLFPVHKVAASISFGNPWNT